MNDLQRRAVRFVVTLDQPEGTWQFEPKRSNDEVRVGLGNRDIRHDRHPQPSETTVFIASTVARNIGRLGSGMCPASH